jgi:AcrR family transcriptional regulator
MTLAPDLDATAAVRRGDVASKRVAIVDAALACVAARGLKATTVDDVARCAGMSRATLYRTLPGGRDDVLRAMGETELARFFSALAVAMGGADDLEAALVAGITTAARWVADSGAIQTVLATEPDELLRNLSFGQMDQSLAIAAAFSAPFFGRWLEHEQALRAAEWATRIVLSYLLDPTEGVDLADEDDVTHLVQRFVLPGIEALGASASPSCT